MEEGIGDKNIERRGITKMAIEYIDRSLSSADIIRQRKEGEEWSIFSNRIGNFWRTETVHWLRYRMRGHQYTTERDFSNLDMSGANLLNADFSYCDFRDTNLSDADLERSKVTKADFRGADLSNADLTAVAGLSEANTVNVKGLTGSKEDEKSVARALIKRFRKDPYLLQNSSYIRDIENGKNDLAGWLNWIIKEEYSNKELFLRFPSIGQFYYTYEETTIEKLELVANGDLSVYK